MVEGSFDVIREQVFAKAQAYSGEHDAPLEEALVGDLFTDGWDFVDFCEDLERTYSIDLRPFFEDGQPEIGWWIWRTKFARDATVGELANHVVQLVTRCP